MQARHVEVVQVAGPEFSINSLWPPCRCDTPTGRALDSGFYVALWSDRRDGTASNNDLSLHGPLATEAQAKLLAVSARAFGLTEGTRPRRRASPAGKPARPSGCSIGSAPPVGRAAFGLRDSETS